MAITNDLVFRMKVMRMPQYGKSVEFTRKECFLKYLALALAIPVLIPVILTPLTLLLPKHFRISWNTDKVM